MKKQIISVAVLSILTVGAARAETITINGVSVTTSGYQTGTYYVSGTSNCMPGYISGNTSTIYILACGVSAAVCEGSYAQISGYTVSKGNWVRDYHNSSGNVYFCTSSGWVSWADASSYSSGSTYYSKAIECTSASSCIAHTAALCGYGYYNSFWSSSASCSTCPSSGWSNNPATSVPGSNTANTGCYVKPNISNTDEKGTWHYTENCYYSAS